ncbi:hypothetical protein D3C71_2006320 [compost metagenome]
MMPKNRMANRNSAAVGATVIRPVLMNSPICPRLKPASRQTITGRVVNATTGLILRSNINPIMASIIRKPRVVIMLQPLFLLLSKVRGR